MQMSPEAWRALEGASLTCQGHLACGVTTGRVIAFLPTLCNKGLTNKIGSPLHWCSNKEFYGTSRKTEFCYHVILLNVSPYGNSHLVGNSACAVRFLASRTCIVKVIRVRLEDNTRAVNATKLEVASSIQQDTYSIFKEDFKSRFSSAVRVSALHFESLTVLWDRIKRNPFSTQWVSKSSVVITKAFQKRQILGSTLHQP